MALLVKNSKNETKWSRKLRKFGQILTLMLEKPKKEPKTNLCAKFWGIWVIRTELMTIFDPILTYFTVGKWLFSSVSTPAKREILDIFVWDEKSSEAVKKVLRYQ